MFKLCTVYMLVFDRGNMIKSWKQGVKLKKKLFKLQVAIELQNTANSVNSGNYNANNINNTCNANTITNNNNNNNNNNDAYNFANTMNHQFIDFNSKLVTEMIGDEENFEVNNEFGDLLGFDDWEQMLDEDCISRLTADFNHNINNMTATTTTATTGKPLVLPVTLACPIVQTTSPIKNKPLTPVNTSLGSDASQTLPKIQHITSTKVQPKQILLVPSSAASSTNNQQQHIKPQISTKKYSEMSNPNVLTTTGSNNTSNKSLSSMPTTVISTSNVVKRLSSVMLSENHGLNNSKTLITTTTASTANNKGQNASTSLISTLNNNNVRKLYFVF